MLLLARADRGETADGPAQAALVADVHKIIEFLEPLMEEKALSVDRLGDAVASVDRALFRRAMGNLLHNAIQHSPPGSRLRVALREQHDGIEVEVSNPGAAIPGEHLTRLFDRFFRADPSRAYTQDSHGLGLAIVKAIAKMHGSTVLARSGGGINTIGLTLEG